MQKLMKNHLADEARRKETERIIRKGMVDQDMLYLEELALAMGKSRPVISKRLSGNSWSLEEMVKLVKVLRLSTEDAAIILGVTTKGGRT